MSKSKYDPRFKRLQLRLLSFYLGTILLILTTAAGGLYMFFVGFLHEQFEEYIHTWEDRATDWLVEITYGSTQPRESRGKENQHSQEGRGEHLFSENIPQQHETLAREEGTEKSRFPSDEEREEVIHGKDLDEPPQCIEVFDPNRQLMARKGRRCPSQLLSELSDNEWKQLELEIEPNRSILTLDKDDAIAQSVLEENECGEDELLHLFYWQCEGFVQSGPDGQFLLEVYRYDPADTSASQSNSDRAIASSLNESLNESLELIGYIRTSESTEKLTAVEGKLKWGLGLVGLLAFGISTVGGIWLTRQSIQPVEKSFEQLKQFTADASHELRTPLTALKTAVAVMQSHPERIDPADEKKVAAIASAANQMTRLVEDLLLLTRIDSASAIASTQSWIRVPLDEILEDIIDWIEIEAQEKGIVLESRLLPDSFVMGNARQLQRLFANLLANAVQYTPAGGTVTLSMHYLPREAIVEVQDTGIGIAPQDLPRICDRFWRADRARSRRQGGMGMGLAIAQSIVQTHRGKMVITSQLGAGSSFRVCLPLSFAS